MLFEFNAVDLFDVKELLFEFNAVDLGFSGNKFTWAKGNWGSAPIKRRLDRGVTSISWRLAYPNAAISHLGAIKSDHSPILLDTNPKDSFTYRPFRFEATWLRDESCHSVIEIVWNIQASRSKFIKLYKRQASTRDALRTWNEQVFSRCQDRINLLPSKIKHIQEKPPSQDNELTEKSLQAKLSKWLLKSEVIWCQKSRELWLKLQDKNSKFFHLSTIIRRRGNHVNTIKKDDDSRIHDSSQIRELFRNNFMDLFKEEDICFPKHLEHLVLPSITKAENNSLLSIPPPEEIKATLFQMQDQKAPGPDGFLALFYKQLWLTVSDDVIKAVTSFFQRGIMPREVNCSLIVLIPKVSNPTSVNHFRPISLCNIVYKIILKLLVAKLHPLLNRIISPTQSAFIPNRWIVENQIIIQEIIHSFKTRKTNPGLMAIKLDLQRHTIESTGSSSNLFSYILVLMKFSLAGLLPAYPLFCSRSL